MLTKSSQAVYRQYLIASSKRFFSTDTQVSVRAMLRNDSLYDKLKQENNKKIYVF